MTTIPVPAPAPFGPTAPAPAGVAVSAIIDYLRKSADEAKRELDDVRRRRYIAEGADQSAQAARLLVNEYEAYATWSALDTAWFQASRIAGQR